MEPFNEQQFPTEFILDYIKTDDGRQRFLTYVMFRFLAFAGKADSSLADTLTAQLSRSFAPEDFSAVENYLHADYYFSPSLAEGTCEPLYLCIAIHLAEHAAPAERAAFEALIAAYAPAAAGLSYTASDADWSVFLQTGADYYGALYLALMADSASLPALLLQFAKAYRQEYSFTNEDFILFDFMDEYFEETDCRHHASFVEMIDTLVAATLNYYSTDFGTLLEKEGVQMRIGTSSRFAGIRRFGSVILPAVTDTDRACHMLAGLFRYAAVYELRNNLFDFHLDEDKLITLSNWKENLRWHYVQYANVYELAMDSFYAACLSNTLLHRQFSDNLASLSH